MMKMISVSGMSGKLEGEYMLKTTINLHFEFNFFEHGGQHDLADLQIDSCNSNRSIYI